MPKMSRTFYDLYQLGQRGERRMSVNHMFHTRRTSVDLALGMVVALVVVVLNVTINFTDGICRFFSTYANLPLLAAIVNFLLFWLAVLLWLAFARWHAANRRRADLEAVLMSISPDILMVVSPERNVLMTNDSMHRLFGYTDDEVVGQSTDMLYSDRRRRTDHPHEIYEALERDGFHIGLATGTRKNGTTFPLEIITGDIRGRAGAVLLLRDITYRLEEEKRRRTLEVQIQQQQKLESLGLLAGGIAHDFNNLLGAILGNADLAFQDLPDASPVRQNVAEILKAGQRSADLCRELIAYSGKGRFLVEPLDLSQLVRDMEHFLSASISKKVIVTYNLADSLPPMDGDATQIRQVLLNLMTNAADAIEGQEGFITVSTAKTEVDAAYLESHRFDKAPPPGHYVLLRVADTGRGMTEQARERMFDPFYSTTPGSQGLGLAAVLGIVHGHHGSIRVESEPGSGTTITILFPCLVKATRDADASTETEWKGQGTVLVVDDEAAIRDLASAMFTRLGFTTLTASHGVEAIEILERRHTEISLVLLDMTMPKMNGEEVYRRLRTFAPDMPVLLSSGHDESHAADLVNDEQRAGYIQKPYTYRNLLERVRALIPNSAA